MNISNKGHSKDNITFNKGKNERPNPRSHSTEEGAEIKNGMSCSIATQ